MIEEILPLTKIRLDILSELYLQPLQGKSIAEKINKKPQVTHNTLTSMSEILEKDKNLYNIKSEYKFLLDKLLIKFLLRKRLGKDILILSYIKKHLNPIEMIFFGSYFRGDFNESSDIDIYILTTFSSNEVKEVEQKLSKSIGKKVQIVNVHPKIHLTNKDKFSDLYYAISKNINQGIKIPLEIL